MSRCFSPDNWTTLHSFSGFLGPASETALVMSPHKSWTELKPEEWTGHTKPPEDTANILYMSVHMATTASLARCRTAALIYWHQTQQIIFVTINPHVFILLEPLCCTFIWRTTSTAYVVDLARRLLFLAWVSLWMQPGDVFQGWSKVLFQQHHMWRGRSACIPPLLTKCLFHNESTSFGWLSCVD